MARRRTLFIYNTSHVNGEHIIIDVMLLRTRRAKGLMITGISFLIIGIIFTVMDDHEEEIPFFILGIANIVFGSILIGFSLIYLGVLHHQQKRQAENGNIPYNPPMPGSYPAQSTTIYPANPGSYQEAQHGQATYVYPPPPCAVQQVNPISSASQPLSAASFGYQNPAGVSDMSSSIEFQAPEDSSHQKAAGSELQDMKESPPPYTP